MIWCHFIVKFKLLAILKFNANANTKWIHFQMWYPMENHSWISNIVRNFAWNWIVKVSWVNKRVSFLLYLWFSLCIDIKIYWAKIFKMILSNMNVVRIMNMPIGSAHIEIYLNFVELSLYHALCLFSFLNCKKELAYMYVCFVKPASHWILINLTYLLEFSLFS